MWWDKTEASSQSVADSGLQPRALPHPRLVHWGKTSFGRHTNFLVPPKQMQLEGKPLVALLGKLWGLHYEDVFSATKKPLTAASSSRTCGLPGGNLALGLSQ